MYDTYYALTILVLTISIFSFVIYRLSFFKQDKISGRIPFLFGGIFIIISIFWNLIESLTAYSEWFLEGAYPIFDAVQFVFYITGILLIASGLALYADFWLFRQDELEIRDKKLSIINDLQQVARQPFQIFELLNISLKEIIGHLDETSGAFFLVNRTRRELILTSYAGITQQETAVLEHYQLGRNIVTQAIETAQAVIGGEFIFNETIDNRFKSCIAIPVISGTDKYGIVLLLSEKRQAFGQSEIKYLMPISEWLGEKIKTTRLTKEISSIKELSEKNSIRQNNFNQRMSALSNSFSSADPVEGFCRSLIGLLEAKSVHMIGMKSSVLQFYGGSEPISDLSENFKTALIDALDRDKPLILNQEAVTDENRNYIARSTLIYPIKSNTEKKALMFINESGAIQVDDEELSIIEIFSNLATVALNQNENQSLNISRRKGLDKILGFLRFDKKIDFNNPYKSFVNYLESAMPGRSIGIVFNRRDNGTLFVSGNYNEIDLSKMEIYCGEGIVGNMGESTESKFVSGKGAIEKALTEFEQNNRNMFTQLFGENGLPEMMAVCPIYGLNSSDYNLAVIFMYDISEEEKGEWQRLLTLADGLYSIRLTIESLKAVSVETNEKATGEFIPSGQMINKLNNHLSIIMGQSELMAIRKDISDQLKDEINKVLHEAEAASGLIKDLSDPKKEKLSNVIEKQVSEPPINQTIETVLEQSFISDNLYMISGRPREVQLNLDQVSDSEISPDDLHRLFEEALNRFGSIASEEDIFTIATYEIDDYLYLDISRHHKNFPPVDQVAEFGDYLLPEDVLDFRPTDTFLEHMSQMIGFYAYDKHSTEPTYLSFKFPAISDENFISPPIRKPKILAIDDQQLILDLISAMCQTVGYDVITADTGRQGLDLATENDFDVVLTDLAMPGMSGLEVAEEIKKAKPNVPIILITGWEVNIEKERLDTSGIIKVLYKPFRIEQLTEIINDLVEQKYSSGNK
jgi:CheY-like chemotaxis protein/drug/metabolite transporter superfamily protein YnfA/putative methionine-R-sulfoxide reductase with GAF domain